MKFMLFLGYFMAFADCAIGGFAIGMQQYLIGIPLFVLGILLIREFDKLDTELNKDNK